MTYAVYGYIESCKISSFSAFFENLEKKTNIGIELITTAELYNFPDSLLSSFNENCAAFNIGDKPGMKYIAYLTSYDDFAPEADIELPLKGDSRLELLINFLKTMVYDADATRLVVAINNMDQIEEVQTASFRQMDFLIKKDFSLYDGPPDCIYDFLI